MLILYDDTALTPAPIRQIIGVDRFSDLLKQRRRLGEIIEQRALACAGHSFSKMSSEEGRAIEIEKIERTDPSEKIFRLPSALVPGKLDIFSRTLEKLPYALDRAVFGGRFDDEAAALLPRDDALALLRIRDPKERRAFFSALSSRSLQIGNDMDLLDLRDVDSFLEYMTGATEARQFNRTEIASGIFRKTSSNIGKMRAEHRYFHIATEPMKRFLLPTFDYREEAGEASYAMEHISVPDAAIQFIHHSFDETSFQKLLNSFCAFLHSRDRKTVGFPGARQAARQEILEKMRQRLAVFRSTEHGQRVDSILKASGPCGGLREIQNRAERLITHAIERDRTDSLALGHGDPCLSNILFSRDIGLFRLIDPRGAETAESAFSHPLYDIAKFSHSVLGGYDFVNNDLFDCRIGEDLRVTLELEKDGPPTWAKNAFINCLSDIGVELNLVRTYEMSLFLSMLPLHLDCPRKLPAFCLTACSIMDEIEQ